MGLWIANAVAVFITIYYGNKEGNKKQ